ncbi:MAG: hypothetical protein QW434_08030 [Pyrobaculum sp.]
MFKQLSALIYYLHFKKKERGTVVAVRIVDLCGVDRSCNAEVRKILNALVERGVAVRHKPGVYLISRRDVDRAIKILTRMI